MLHIFKSTLWTITIFIAIADAKVYMRPSVSANHSLLMVTIVIKKDSKESGKFKIVAAAVVTIVSITMDFSV